MRQHELTCKISSTEILSSWQGKFWISASHSYVRFFNINFVTTSARAHNFIVAGFISDSLISQLFSTPTIESQFLSIFAISADTSLILTSPDCVSRIVSGPRVASARPSPRRYWIPSNTYPMLISNAPARDFNWLTGLTIPTSSSVVIEQLEAKMWLTDTSVGSQINVHDTSWW